MKILYITNHLKGTDGWSRYSATLIQEVVRHGHEIRVIASEDGVSVCGIQASVCLKSWHEYLANPIQCFISARAIADHIRIFAPDIIHILAEPYANMMPFLSLTSRTKVFMTIHGTFAYPPHLQKSRIKRYVSSILYALALKKTNYIVAVSNYTKKYFIHAVGDKHRPEIIVVTNWVQIPDSREHHAKSVIPQILFVGAIKGRKGIRESIEALAYYRDYYHKDFRYVVVGHCNTDDSYFKEIQFLIQDYSLQSNVRFTGEVSDDERNRHYDESHLFMMLPVHNSGFEGFGLVYLEANAHGLPVLGGGAEDSGAPEAIANGASGFVVRSDDAEKAAYYIDQILNKGAISRERCVQWAEENRIEKKVSSIMNLYEHVTRK